MKKLLIILALILPVAAFAQQNIRNNLNVYGSTWARDTTKVNFLIKIYDSIPIGNPPTGYLWVYNYLDTIRVHDHDGNILKVGEEALFVADSAFLLHWADTLTTIATKTDVAGVTITEEDPIYAVDSADILFFADTLSKIATRSDLGGKIDTTHLAYDITAQDTTWWGKIYVETELDPIYAIDSADILFFSDTSSTIATKTNLGAKIDTVHLAYNITVQDTTWWGKTWPETLFVGDSANLLHWADTTSIIATAYDIGAKIDTTHLAYDITAQDTTWWGRAETDPYYAADSLTLLNNVAEMDSLLDYWSTYSSAGRLWGGIITDATGGKVNIAAGQGLVKDESAGLEDEPTALNNGQASTLSLVTWTAQSDFTLAGVGYNLIYWDASAGAFAAQLKENFYANFDFTRDFTIGRVYYDGSAVTIRLCGMNMWNFPRRVQMFGEERFPVERATGMMIGETGTRNITLTAGVIWAELVNRFSVSAFNSSTGGTFTYWYRDGGTGWTSVATQTQIDNTYWDDNSGTLNDLTASRYGVHWVYEVHDGSVHVVYGQGDYTLANANLASPPTDYPGLLESYATLVGKIIVQKSASAFTSIQSPFVTQFTAGSVTNHNDLSGLQGGTTSEYYHLTATDYGMVTGMDTTRLAFLDKKAIFTDTVQSIHFTDGTAALSGGVLSGAVIIHNTALSADSTYSGVVETYTAGENLAFGDFVYQKSDGLVWKADASAVATGYCIGVVVATINTSASGYVLTNGTIRHDDVWNWSLGSTSPIFLSETLGGATQTAPTTASAVVQVLGRPITADIMKVAIDQTVIEVK